MTQGLALRCVKVVTSENIELPANFFYDQTRERVARERKDRIQVYPCVATSVDVCIYGVPFVSKLHWESMFTTGCDI